MALDERDFFNNRDETRTGLAGLPAPHAYETNCDGSSAREGIASLRQGFDVASPKFAVKAGERRRTTEHIGIM